MSPHEIGQGRIVRSRLVCGQRPIYFLACRQSSLLDCGPFVRLVHLPICHVAARASELRLTGGAVGRGAPVDAVHRCAPLPKACQWRQIYRQFGVDPTKSSDKATLSNFRTDCLRELKKIKDSWPDLHYQTIAGALLLSPSPPCIAPSQLHLFK